MQARGEFAPLQEQLAPALELPGQPVKRGTMAHEHIVYMMLADSAAQANDLEAIRRYAPRLEDLASRDEHQPYLAVAHRALGVAHRLAGENAKAEARLVQALDTFERMQTRWQIGRTLMALAELELARADPPAACERYSQALSEFEALGAGPAAEQTRAALEACA